MKWLRLLLVTAALLVPGAQGLAQARSQLSLHLSHRTAAPGDVLQGGVSIQLPPGWHTYWQNSGESGLPATLRWELPDGILVGDLRWPVPSRHVDGEGDFTITTLVLEGRPVICFPVTVAPDARPGPRTLKVRVDWQECETACVRGTTNLTFQLQIGPTAERINDPILASGWNVLPSVEPEGAPPNLHWIDAGTGTDRTFRVTWTVPSAARQIDFFPYRSRTIEPGLTPSGRTVAPPAATADIRVIREDAQSWPDTLGGLLVAYDGSGGVIQALEQTAFPIVAVGPSDTVANEPPPSRPPFSAVTLLTMLGFAFIGGVILNIMPCVLPVLALKVLSFVRQAGSEPARVRGMAWMYAAGVLSSFATLAGVALAIQAGGGVASWGSAFQNPLFRVGMTVLMVLVALNLFGVFEVSLAGGAASKADELARREGPAGAFFHGLLAAVLATPCMAPFLATAMAFAFTQPPMIVLLVFLAVGAGLAAPFVLLCLRPTWLKMLPKPGAWMVRFKVAMGFPLLATAVWLFWFTAKRLGDEGVLWLGLLLVLLAAAAWVWGEFVQKSSRRNWLAIGIAASLVAVGYFGILERQLDWRGARAGSRPAVDWKTWSPAAVQQAQAEGHPVLVDFTADNCVNCKLNKVRSIEIPETIRRLEENRFVSLLGDFTDPDPAIAAELKRFGRYGVPLVLVYPGRPGAEPTVLPPLFGPDTLHQAIEAAVR